MIEKDLEELFYNKRILVTGGIGSIGSMIVKKLLQFKIKEVIVIDNRETELFYAKSMYNVKNFQDKRVSFVFADIRDESKIVSLFEKIDIVFHAAAMKHVIICEENPFEAVKTNINGTKNVINACISNNVDKMILISTDKSVNPSNVMGATKLLSERLVSAVSFSKNNNSKTKFGIVRFGNVLNSRGSVLEIWRKQIKKKQKITITEPNMTRFFMSIPQSVDLIFQATYYTKNGETFILKMPSVRIIDLAKIFLKLNNLSENFIDFIGIRKGEKMDEELLLNDEEGQIYENDKLFIRLPIFFTDYELKERIKLGFFKSKISSFSSSDKKYLLNLNDIENVIKKEIKND